ncbi:DUF7500 family protein [Halegenticoccus soli]|uniref:DUF7500 family protein n=1 Tax=Halegenticoccus soli TaxID=1985678 RepID=UPI000C6D3669|nr:hypothetical protein [Halegenticoccus soli]
MSPERTDDAPGRKRERKGSVLSPEDLELGERDGVVELADGRYLISTGDGAPTAPPPTDGSGGADESDGGDDPGATDAADTDDPDAAVGSRAEPNVDAAAVGRWLARSLSESDLEYGIDATIKSGDSVSRHRVFSDDVVVAFETLLLWYAGQIGGETPPEETLGILFAESDLPIRYPARALVGALKRNDLGPEDAIADLLAAADDEGLDLSPPR